jgi:hypothetical protein
MYYNLRCGYTSEGGGNPSTIRLYLGSNSDGTGSVSGPEWQAINGAPALLSSAFMEAVWQHLMTEGPLQEDPVITGTMAIDPSCH